MRMSRLRQQRLTACTAILAVLLLFVAPTVSKSLMHHQGMGSANPAEAASAVTPADDAPAMSHMAHSHPMAMPDPPAGTGHHAMGMGEDITCGYCELLIHVPLLLWLFAPLLWLMTRIAQAPRPVRLLPPSIRRLALRQRPRAPPAPPFFFVS